MTDENIQDNEMNEKIEEAQTEAGEAVNNINNPGEDEVAELDGTQIPVDDVTEEMVKQLNSELQEARAKSEEYLDGWQRSRAEFSNFKKRVEREQTQIYQSTAGNIIKHFLEIADDLERALKTRPKEGEGALWANGIELVYRKLMSTIESQGVTQFVPEGQFFDPNFHEAISHEDSPMHESGQIIEVVQPGYMLGDRVLRPARVRVAR